MSIVKLKCCECDNLLSVNTKYSKHLHTCTLCKIVQKYNPETCSMCKVGEKHRQPKTPHWNVPRGFCRWCGEEADSKRRHWHDNCLHDYMIQSQSGYARDVVFKRDSGICAYCKVNTQKTIKHYYRLQTRINRLIHYLELKERVEDSISVYKSAPKTERIKSNLKLLLYKKYGLVSKLKDKYMWHLDHIIPLIDGGAKDLSNMQSLCEPCHKEKTKQEAKERSERRKNNKRNNN